MNHAEIPVASAIVTAVLCLTKEAVLALDLLDALTCAGLAAAIPMLSRHPAAYSGARYQAVIVDADGLDGRSAAIVRRLARANVPVVVIADRFDIAERFGVAKSAWFVKPVATDDVSEFVVEMLRGNRPAHDGPRILPFSRPPSGPAWLADDRQGASCPV